MSQARIHQLYEHPLAAEGIERESFRRIDAEAKAHSLSPAEWQEEVMTLDVPQIVVRGRRGGSPLAVATIHALSALAAKGCS